MRLRKLEQSENGLTRGLYEEVFSEDSKAFVDYYYTEKTKDNTIYVMEEEGAIAAMLHLNPYKIMVNGVEKDVNYIVAVATKEAYRRQGYMAALLRQALCDMYEAGQSFTFLMPAAEGIYLPHDFRTVYEQERKYCGEKDTAYFPAKESDCEELAEWANAVLAANFQVFAKRDGAYYRRLIKEYESDGGKLMLARKDGEISDCCIFTPEEADTEEKPKIMVRIVDVRRMLMSVRVKSLIAVCFRVTDSIIEENNRVVVITGTEFSGIMLMDSKPENSEGTLPVAALTDLLFGAKTVEEVCGEEGVVMSDRMREEMKKIVPLSAIYLNEVV